MEKRRIRNFDELATSDIRRKALEIAEAGFDAIDTRRVVKSSIQLQGTSLKIKDHVFDLRLFSHIKVIGFGKASCQAAAALEEILGDRIHSGIVIGTEKAQCKYIETYAGSHPTPSDVNVETSRKIYELSEKSTEDDLVIAVISGGGSSLLCWPEEECLQGERLYRAFLKSGGSTDELNVVRKHISLLKGGGLAKVLYPSTVVGLIFSDMPEGRPDQVASGPTSRDQTTIADAEKIIEKYQLGDFNLVETPKKDKYFEKVHNIVLASNRTALEAMSEKASGLGYEAVIASDALYGSADATLTALLERSSTNTAVIGGGEISLRVTSNDGSGGRNLFLTLKALQKIPESSVFIALASDGIDNSDAAGAIADAETLHNAKEAGLDPKTHIANFDSYTFFDRAKGLIFTGQTNANVSDLMVILNP